ncbi:MAG: hypothetical protein ABFD89_23685 [Bryobacteraceae bacterium]
MTPNDQRIAIATALGWTEIEYARNGIFLFGLDPERGEKRPVPQYTEDLNAMHYAELKCVAGDDSLDFNYRCYLTKTVGSDRDLIHLCAAYQRAEALLKTIGKWVGK